MGERPGARAWTGIVFTQGRPSILFDVAFEVSPRGRSPVVRNLTASYYYSNTVSISLALHEPARVFSWASRGVLVHIYIMYISIEQ